MRSMNRINSRRIFHELSMRRTSGTDRQGVSASTRLPLAFHKGFPFATGREAGLSFLASPIGCMRVASRSPPAGAFMHATYWDEMQRSYDPLRSNSWHSSTVASKIIAGQTNRALCGNPYFVIRKQSASKMSSCRRTPPGMGTPQFPIQQEQHVGNCPNDQDVEALHVDHGSKRPQRKQRNQRSRELPLPSQQHPRNGPEQQHHPHPLAKLDHPQGTRRLPYDKGNET